MECLPSLLKVNRAAWPEEPEFVMVVNCTVTWGDSEEEKRTKRQKINATANTAKIQRARILKALIMALNDGTERRGRSSMSALATDMARPRSLQ